MKEQAAIWHGLEDYRWEEAVTVRRGTTILPMAREVVEARTTVRMITVR